MVKWALWLVVGFFGLFPGIVAYMVWAERKVAARFQDRIGPNRVGPLGLLQPIADALKLLTKENIVPRAADQWVHILAPVLLLVSAFLVLAVMPFGVGHGAGEHPLGAALPGGGLEPLAAGHLPGRLVEPEQVRAARVRCGRWRSSSRTRCRRCSRRSRSCSGRGA